MTEKIWIDDQCPNLGSNLGKTLGQCKQLCTNTAGCTAINYSPTAANGACILRECGNVVPTPKVDNYKYHGYYLNMGKHSDLAEGWSTCKKRKAECLVCCCFTAMY